MQQERTRPNSYLSAEWAQFGERHVPILRLVRKRKNAAQEMTQSCKWMRWWNTTEPLWKSTKLDLFSLNPGDTSKNHRGFLKDCSRREKRGNVICVACFSNTYNNKKNVWFAVCFWPRKQPLLWLLKPISINRCKTSLDWCRNVKVAGHLPVWKGAGKCVIRSQKQRRLFPRCLHSPDVDWAKAASETSRSQKFSAKFHGRWGQSAADPQVNPLARRLN